MASSFPDARVTGYEGLIGSMTNHPKDRHVLAAAVAGVGALLGILGGQGQGCPEFASQCRTLL